VTVNVTFPVVVNRDDVRVTVPALPVLPDVVPETRPLHRPLTVTLETGVPLRLVTLTVALTVLPRLVVDLPRTIESTRTTVAGLVVTTIEVLLEALPPRLSVTVRVTV